METMTACGGCDGLLMCLYFSPLCSLTMGITSSAPARVLTPEQKDIKYMGDRMPFGDEELYLIYRAYHARQALTEHVSFIVDIGSQTDDPERSILLQAVEQKILPPNFGNRLYQTSFCKDGVSEYDSCSDAASSKSRRPPAAADDEYTRLARLERFFDGASNCGRRGAKEVLKVLVACCEPQSAPKSSSPDDTPFSNTNTTSASATASYIKPMELVNMGYRVALASAFLQATARADEDDVAAFLPNEKDTSSPALLSLANSLMECATRRKQRVERSSTPNNNSDKVHMVELNDVLEWAEQVAPLFASSLATFTHNLFFPNRAYPPTRTSFEYPRLLTESTFFDHGSSPLLFSFGCMSSSLSGEYHRLYTSASDGLSFNRLQNALLGYGGPTLIIIRSGDSVFGAFTASQWKESKDFYGNHDCFLYQLLPTTAVYRPSGNDTKFMYCNSFARSRGYDQLAHGIGFGGSTDQPRLFLAESFDDCRAAAQDMTFEKGPLLPGKDQHFVIDDLEVWGVGGTAVVEEALADRKKCRGVRDAAIQKARKVDKAAFLDDFKSGLIDSKAFAHRGQIQGRDATCVDPDSDLK